MLWIIPPIEYKCRFFSEDDVVNAVRIYSSIFLLGFLGLRERLLALHRGQMGALR